MNNSSTAPLTWRLRCAVWDAVLRFKFKLTFDVAKLPLPSANQRPIKPIPFQDYYKAIPISSILNADHIPADERYGPTLFAIKAQEWLQGVLSPMQKGLPPVSGDDQVDLQDAFGDKYRRLFAAPRFPAELNRDGVTDLGHFVLSSPYSCLLEKNNQGEIVWDFRALEAYQQHPGLESLALRVVFELDKPSRGLKAVQIERARAITKPQDPEWPQAVRHALSAATTKMGLVNHFTNIHLVCGNHFSVATRNMLPADHPIKRLIWPPVFGTQYSNDLVMNLQAGPCGDFVNSYSFTFESQCKLFEDFNASYDITVMDPYLDWQNRGMHDLGLNAPAQENLCELFDLMHAHVSRYVQHYYPDDKAVQEDQALQSWLKYLDQAIPNGISAFTKDGVTRQSVARILGAYYYVGAALHEALGTSMWDYVSWNSKIPIRVYSSGQEVPLDVYKRYVTFNFMLSVHRAQFLDDYSYFALDAAGEELWRQFRAESNALQAKYDALQPTSWRMLPKIMEIGMNTGR